MPNRKSLLIGILVVVIGLCATGLAWLGFVFVFHPHPSPARGRLFLQFSSLFGMIFVWLTFSAFAWFVRIRISRRLKKRENFG